MSFGRLPNVNWQQDSTMVHQLKMSSYSVLVVKFLSINLLLKWFLLMMRHKTATIRQRNVINYWGGDQVEFYGPGFRHFETYIEDCMMLKEIKSIVHQTQMELLTIKVPQPVQAGDMVRALKEGLINLYKEDGTSVTVRCLDKDEIMVQAQA